MDKRPRPFTAERRKAEVTGTSIGITNDDLMDAISDLKDNVNKVAGQMAEIAAAPPPPPPPEPDNTDELGTIKQDVSALRAVDPDDDKLVLARGELKTVTEITDKSANEIMNQSDEIHVVIDKIREDLSAGNTDKVESHCATLEEIATNLLMACEFQDLTGQRLNKVSNALLGMEDKIGGLFTALDIAEGTGAGGLSAVTDDDQRPDTDLLHGPQDEGEGISQADIDSLFD
ncbi:MAG: hypothetical protein O3B76_03585 [Proteobacteria bacterium]|nr:hypothetical protein [Pseudomonadota bacterium]MDA1022659.1 hypothetical protein [Pseudomonadota bacterium]